MCSMTEQERCAVDQKLDRMTDRFNALEAQVSSLIKRLDGHDKALRIAKHAGFFLAGLGVGTGLVSLKALGLFTL